MDEEATGGQPGFGTQPLRLVDQRTMTRVFEVTDARGISREAIRVPLVGDGDGSVRGLPGGVWEIVVPAAGPLEPFLARLAAALDGAARA
ncbi:MAG: hypothetical protein F9K18_12215 [Thermoanaerobaculia bacterium]|nr:MAG: hypothetical protein F9K18_12215 [Thermoanaerobaculia bacterium]